MNSLTTSIEQKWRKGRNNALTRLGLLPDYRLNIYLARHMKSVANLDPALHQMIPDMALQTLPDERPEGEKAARFLTDYLHGVYERAPRRFGRVLVLYSPFIRTQHTAVPYLYFLNQRFGDNSGRLFYRLDDRLIELQQGLRDGLRGQEFGRSYPDAESHYRKHHEYGAQVYAPSPMGESYMQLSWRVRQVQPVILDAYRRMDVRHCLIVGHGGTNRAFVQGWLNYDPRWITAEQNPENNWIRHLQGIPESQTVVDPGDFTDNGYIYGHEAPLHNPAATQHLQKGADMGFAFQSQDARHVVPPGVSVTNPLKGLTYP